MSTAQRNDACLIAVDPFPGGILRLQTLVVLQANHHYFEDVRDLDPAAQFALSVIYRDAFAVLDALGWAPAPEATTSDVPLTAGHIEQLRHCRYDLGHTNLDRLDTLDRQIAVKEIGGVRGELDADRLAAQGLDQIFAAYHLAAHT